MLIVEFGFNYLSYIFLFFLFGKFYYKEGNFGDDWMKVVL